MEENEVVEQEVEEIEPDFDAFDEAWAEDNEAEGITGDHDDDEQETEEAEPTDEPENVDDEAEAEDGEEAEETSPEQGEAAQEGNQLYEITYLGNKEKLTLEQLTELAQKGRDYDHVRQERDSLKDGTGRRMAFLEKLAAKAGVSVDEQIDLTEAMWLMDAEAEKGNTLTEAEALLRVQRERGKPPDKPAGKDEVPEGFNEQIDRFIRVYPDVTGDQIPQEVWDETKKNGGDLLVAYQSYMIKTLKAEKAKNSQADTNERNKARSTGPLRSAGKSRQTDSFDEGWDS